MRQVDGGIWKVAISITGYPTESVPQPVQIAACSEQVHRTMQGIEAAYFRLALVAGPARSGKTSVLRDLAARSNWPLLNVGLRLSERLIELTKRQRAVRISSILSEVVCAEKSAVLLLDNIELLFAPDMACDPLRLLQVLSRIRTIIVGWPGSVRGETLTYAALGHQEARRYPTNQLCIFEIGAASPLYDDSLEG